jgi:hypothetical protein
MGGHGRGRGGPLGGRRPLRFLAWKLGLSEEQLRAVAAILSELKTTRAAAHVERRRAAARYAEAVEGAAFDAEKAAQAAGHQEAADAALRESIRDALARLHGLLDDAQRAELGLLLREAPPWML